MEKEYYVINNSIVDVNEKTVKQYGLRTKKTNVSHVKLKELLKCLDFYDYMICNQDNEIIYDQKNNVYDFKYMETLIKYLNDYVIIAFRLSERLKIYIYDESKI